MGIIPFQTTTKHVPDSAFTSLPGRGQSYKVEDDTMAGKQKSIVQHSFAKSQAADCDEKCCGISFPKLTWLKG